MKEAIPKINYDEIKKAIYKEIYGEEYGLRKYRELKDRNDNSGKIPNCIYYIYTKASIEGYKVDWKTIR